MMEDKKDTFANQLKCWNQIKNIDYKTKDRLLEILMAFMIFESEFFESPVYQTDRNAVEYKSVMKRMENLQEKINCKGLDISECEWFKRFKNFFSALYIENNRDRFQSLQYSEENMEGVSKECMQHLESFLRYDFDSRKYSSDCSVVNAIKICYIFRNNICHGKKGLVDLQDDTYRNEFHEISIFLINLMKFLHENNIGKV